MKRKHKLSTSGMKDDITTDIKRILKIIMNKILLTNLTTKIKGTNCFLKNLPKPTLNK